MNNIYGIKDAANILVQKKADGKPSIYSDYATEVANQWQHDSVYAMSKSTRAIRWDYNKQSTLKMTLEIFDLKWLSLMTGSDFIKGISEYKKRQILTVDENSKVSLETMPKIGSLSLFILDSDGLTHLDEQVAGNPATNQNEFSINALELTFNTTSCPEGTKVVAYYLADTISTAQTMHISANVFPEQVEIFADSMIRDTDGQDKFAQIHYLNAKAKGNFTLTMSASAITKLEIEFDLLKDSFSDDIATYTIL